MTLFSSESVLVLNEDNVVVDTIVVGFSPFFIEYNPKNNYMYVTNEASSSVPIIDQNNVVVDIIPVGIFPSGIAFSEGNGNMYVASAGLDAVFVIGETSLPINGIKGSGNNINIQVQENFGNDIGGQSDLGGTYSDSPIHQGQYANQDSSVVS